MPDYPVMFTSYSFWVRIVFLCSSRAGPLEREKDSRGSGPPVLRSICGCTAGCVRAKRRERPLQESPSWRDQRWRTARYDHLECVNASNQKCENVQGTLISLVSRLFLVFLVHCHPSAPDLMSVLSLVFVTTNNLLARLDDYNAVMVNTLRRNLRPLLSYPVCENEKWDFQCSVVTLREREVKYRLLSLQP